MAMTRRGVYHNLEESEYRVSNGDTLLVFSSMFYLNKFMTEHKEYRGKFIRGHKAIASGFSDEIVLLSDLHYYKTIEKRGFRVVCKGVAQRWENVVVSVLLREIEGNTKGWQRMQEQRFPE